jgi:hypothetical protein
VNVVFGAAAFDDIRGEGKRSAAKADQRHIRRQRAPGAPNCLVHIVECAYVCHFAHPIDIRCLTYRVVYLRAVAPGELQFDAHWLNDQEDIGKNDRGVNTQSLNGGYCHLSSEIRALTELKKAGSFTHFAIFAHVAAGLSH